MHTDRFGSRMRVTATSGTRRGVLRGLAGGLLAVVGMGRAVAVAQPAPKVEVCHYDAETDTFVPITISGNALDAHVAHGDVPVTENPNHCGEPSDPPVIAAVHDGELVEGGPVITGDSCPYTIVGAPYDAYTIAHPGGALSLGVIGAPGGLFDPVLLLFVGSSAPEGDMCFPRVGFADDSGCGTDAYLEIADLAAGTYTAVVTGYVGEEYGAYQFGINTFTNEDFCSG